MYQEERLTAIFKYMKEHKSISVQEICDLYGVSRDTARRDIVKMEEQGIIIRTRGGAILPTLMKDIRNYEERLHLQSNEKREIGRLASSLIKDGDYIILDASTTVQFAAEALSSKGNVVVTNSIDIADVLAEKEDTSVHLLGGKLHPKHRYLYGARTRSMLSDYRVDKLFLGACGITSEGIFTDDEEDGDIKKEMMKRADQVIVLANHSKFGKKYFYRVGCLEDIDIIVTDQQADIEMRELLEQHQIELITMPEI